MINRVEEATDVRVEHPVHLALRYCDIERVQGLLLTSLRPKAVAETKKVLLVDLLPDQHFSTAKARAKV